MKGDITLVDRGRGLQLSTHRVTVQDLVPYFQEGCPSEEIMRWIPTLTPEEIAIVEHYYREHKEELDQEDREIRERNAQRKNSPQIEKILEEGRAERLALVAKPGLLEDRSHAAEPPLPRARLGPNRRGRNRREEEPDLAAGAENEGLR